MKGTTKSRTRLQRQYQALRQLKNAKTKKVRCAILQKGGNELTTCLSECALNVIKGHVPLTDAQFKKLKRLRSPLQQLASKKISLKRKRRLLEQKGGFLSSLITPLIGVVAKSVLGL